MKSLLTARIEILRYHDQTKPTLKNIDLNINAGEFIILAGPPSSGKSTLCHCLSGVIPLFHPAALIGDVTFEGKSILTIRLPELAGKIGLVREAPEDQLFCTTVEEDLAFGPCNLLLEPEEVKDRIINALKFVGLTGYAKRKTETLSGGESQRAALASILTLNPQVLILDHAMDQVDSEGRREIIRKLRELCRQGEKTVILVDEKFMELQAQGDRVIALNHDTVIFDGRLSEFKSNSAFRSCFEMQPPPIKWPASANNKGFPRVETNEQISLNYSPQVDQDPIISVKNLYFSYRDSDFALRNLCLDICPGEFVALVGKNGAGKTTLAKHFNGLLCPQSGEVVVNGMNTKDYTIAQLASHVGFLFQNSELQVCTNSVQDEVSFALKVKKLPSQEVRNKVSKILHLLGLQEVAQIHPYRLPRGLLRKVALASCLVNEPRLLIIDEPTSRMSDLQARETMGFVETFNKQGRTILMITHDLELAMRFSQRIVFMEDGQIKWDIHSANWNGRRERYTTYELNWATKIGVPQKWAQKE